MYMKQKKKHKITYTYRIFKSKRIYSAESLQNVERRVIHAIEIISKKIACICKDYECYWQIDFHEKSVQTEGWKSALHTKLQILLPKFTVGPKTMGTEVFSGTEPTRICGK